MNPTDNAADHAATTTNVLPTCSFTWQGYPHPGCAEFGPPDSFECDALATHRFSTADGPYGSEPALVCAEHVADAAEAGGTDVARLDDAWMTAWLDGGVAAAAETAFMHTQDALAWMHATPAEEPYPSPRPDDEGFTFGWNAEIGRKATELYEAERAEFGRVW